MVVVEQRELNRRARVDGGSFNLNVGSNDALDVLLANARPGQQRWVDALRTSADLHLVVVTDDKALGNGADYVARLAEVLGGMRFRLHVLGGLDTPGHGVLAATEPISTGRCRSDGLLGLDPGEAYQEAARLTNGLRVPLCYEEARRKLSDELLCVPPQNLVCGWLLDSAGQRIDRVDAVGPRRPSTGLIEERVLANCYATRRSYRRAGPLLVLCEDTCAALKSEGFEAVEVKLACVE